MISVSEEDSRKQGTGTWISTNTTCAGKICVRRDLEGGKWLVRRKHENGAHEFGAKSSAGTNERLCRRPLHTSRTANNNNINVTTPQLKVVNKIFEA